MKNRAVLIAVIEIMLLIIVITMAVIKHDNIVGGFLLVVLWGGIQ